MAVYKFYGRSGEGCVKYGYGLWANIMHDSRSKWVVGLLLFADDILGAASREKLQFSHSLGGCMEEGS